jgi:hypothetical protein
MFKEPVTESKTVLRQMNPVHSVTPFQFPYISSRFQFILNWNLLVKFGVLLRTDVDSDINFNMPGQPRHLLYIS